MLSRAHRMRRSQDFRDAVRAGARAGAGTLVLHLLLTEPDEAEHAAQIGFIVNKSVGPAVVRNRVRRRLRHHARAIARELPEGALLVVRALPAAAAASGEVLQADLESCLARVRRKTGPAVPA
jgi:ribonuclease P protein component